MREVYVKTDLAKLYNTLMDNGIEVYISQDGLTMDMELNHQVFRIIAMQTNDGYILVDSITTVK